MREHSKIAIILRILILITGITALVLSIINMLTYYSNAGTTVCIIGSCLIIICGLFFNIILKLKWLAPTLIIFLMAAMIFMFFLYFYGSNDNVSYDEDVVIVLGAAVRGEAVSTVLAERLAKTVEYYQKNPDCIIVVSGGQGQGEAIPEALAMERWLVRNGVPIENIIKEENSTNTFENLSFSKEILGEIFNRPYSTVVVTSDFHIFRSVCLAKKLGYERITHSGAKIAGGTIPMSYFRECLAIGRMLFFGK